MVRKSFSQVQWDGSRAATIGGLIMPNDVAFYMEMRRKYLANRATFPVEELAKYAGQWIAWSPDGSHVAASAEKPEMLTDLLRAAGEDPSYCVVEGIPGDEVMI